MNFWLPRLGPPVKILSLALLVTLFLLLITSIFPLSKGDIYFRRLNHWQSLVISKKYSQADILANHLDNQDIAYYALHHHPSFLTTTIQKILKKPNRSTDDLIEVGLLYYQMADLENCRHFLLLAKQQDPIRSDIDVLFHQLF